MSVDIEIREQTTILDIKSGTNVIKIKSIATLPASYTSIISKFFETFEIISIEPIKKEDYKLPIKV